MELSSLKFATDTKELLDAKKAIDDLGVSISGLNKATREEAKIAIDSEKVKQQQAKTSEAVAKAKIAEEKANKSSTESTKTSTTVLERQQNILEYMTQGFSKGQASVLTYAKASGALATDLKQLEDVLLTQRKLMGGDPFDKSMSGLVALKNQYGEIREAIRQYNAETGLSREQTRELARDKERIIEKMKLEGASLSDIKQAIRNYNQAYTEAATKVNVLSRAEKDRERGMRDTANATRNVQAAEERLFATVAHLGDIQSNNIKVNERAALALGSYERNLRLAGITGEDAAKKLAKFKAAQEQVSAAEAKNRANYVSRGVGVQLGDVGVSLASGMNPLVVAIQQGDQLRSIIQQSGLEATQMAGIMQQAFKGIITSFKDVGVAMGSFVAGAFEVVGKKVIMFDAQMKLLENARKYVADVSGEASILTKVFDFAAGAIRGLAVAAGATIIAALGSLAVAMVQTTKANNEATTALLQYGAILGTTRDELFSIANESTKMGTSSNQIKVFFAELIKGGVSSKDSLKVAASAAAEFSAVTGESLSDIAKRYSELGNNPVKVLTELAKNTGLVDVATLDSISSLVKQGNAIEANSKAVIVYSDTLKQLAKDQYDALSPLEQLWINIKIAGGEAWGSVVKFANSDGIINALKGIAISGIALVAVLREVGQTAISAYKALANPFDIGSIWDDYKAQIAIIRKESTDLANNILNGGSGVDTASRQSAAIAASSYEAAKKAEEQLSKFAEKGNKTKKYQEDVKDIILAYTTAISNAAGDQEKMTKLAKDYELAMKGAQEARDKKPRGSTAAGKLNADDNALATLQAKLLAAEKEYAIVSLTGDAQYKLSEAEKERMKIQEQINALKEKGTVGLNAKQIQARQDQLQNLQEQLKVSNQLTEQQKRLNMLRLETQLDEDLKVLKMFPDEREREIKFIQYRNQIIKDGGTLNEEEAKRLRDRIDTEIELNKVIQYRDQFIKNSSAEKQKDFGRQVQGVEAATKSGTFSEGDRATFANTTLSNMGVENTRLQTEAQLEIYRNYYAQLDLLLQKNLISEQDYSSAKAQLVVKENKTRYQAFDNLLTGMASLQNSSVREMAALGKVAAVVQATINTYEGATKALAQGGIMGPVMAAVVIAQGMAQVAAIKSQGFADGGYTGSGGKYDPAGIVHKGEIVWSQEDIAKAGGVSAVENMRKGIGGYSSGVPSSASSTSKMQSSGVSVNIENYGTSKDFEVQQLSETEIRIIARDEAKDVVHKDAPNVVANQIRNPNSNVSKSLSQNTKTQRRR